MLPEIFIELNWWSAAQVSLLGLIGGTLSGFIGSGGAFFMTPGMMNLGVVGPVAVGSNITHKFGKAMVGAKKHGELGHVDKKLAIFMLITAAVGIRLAVWVMSLLFESGGSSKGGAGANLYISAFFVVVLLLVSVSMLRDIIETRKKGASMPSRTIVDFLNRLRLEPMIYFRVADVRVSLWVVLICGLATGYMAGTIGVGGFIGVPAMIYVFGVSSQVAAGTELFLAMFMGAWGALNYGFEGLVDLRLTALLYLGSLVGIHIGTFGTKVVKELYIRLVTCLIILLCVLSRAIAIPAYLRQLGYVSLDPGYDPMFNGASKALLYGSGIVGALVIYFFVFRAYVQLRKVRAALVMAGSGQRATNEAG